MWSSLTLKNRGLTDRPLYLLCSFEVTSFHRQRLFIPAVTHFFPFCALFSLLNWFLHYGAFFHKVTLIYKRSLQTDATLLANNTVPWKLHVVSVFTPCCMWLSVVGIEVVAQSVKPVKIFPHGNRRNIVNCCVCFHVALSVSCAVSKEYTAMFRRTLRAWRHNRNHTVNLTLSRSILTQFCTITKLFSFFFLPFFYSSAFSVFDIKIKIECKGDQYVILWKLDLTKG